MTGGKCKDKKVTLPFQPVFNSSYHKQRVKTAIADAFKSKTHVEEENGLVLHSEPFQVCVMPDFAGCSEFLQGLKEEILDQIFFEKNNDLYKFQQTDDLKNITAPHLNLIKKFIYEDVRSLLQEMTGISLNDKVDITCSRYGYTDVLLCHDDELDTRCIAFILYLVPQWGVEDGGGLDLFSMDEHGQPGSVVKTLTPAWNTFTWFHVTEKSHHQVSEILTQDKTRLSINGWFHAPPVPRPARYIEPNLPLQSFTATEDDLFFDWINPIYLDPEIQGQIQEKFEKDSEIELQDFLKEEKYKELVESLKSRDIQWSLYGPANKRNYHKAASESLPDVVSQCMTFLKSEDMFLTLSNLTGLTLHPLAAGNKSDSGSDAEEDTLGGSFTDMVPGNSAMVDKKQSPENTSSSNFEPENKRLKLDQKPENGDPVLSDNGEAKPADKKKEGDPQCRSEVRRWRHGSYTLVHDTDNTEFALDAMLFCSCQGWQQQYGGYTSYITRGEDEELLTVNPAENSLALVYRDQDTLKFVKHINDRVKDMPGVEYYDCHVIYYE